PAISSSNTQTLRALHYDFQTTSATGSIGTAASPIQTDNLSDTSTATLKAGSGGIYLTDWGSADLNIAEATATGTGNVRLIAANAGGHNLTVAGPVRTGSGNISVLADDDLFIAGPIGGTGFSGTVSLTANRDAGNEQRVVFQTGGSVVTSNNTSAAVAIK